MAGGCGVGAFCSFCGKCGRVFNTLFDTGDVPVVLPPGVSARDVDLLDEEKYLGVEAELDLEPEDESEPASETEPPSE